MIATAKNYDALCFQLRNGLYQRLQNPLKKDVNLLSQSIEKLITAGKKIQPQLPDVLSAVFNLRIKALKWLSADTNFDYLEQFEGIFLKMETLKSYRKLEVLAENNLFALRWNVRVIEALAERMDLTSAVLASGLNHLPGITYQQFIAALTFANPDDAATTNLVNFTNASLQIEFVLFATDIISDGKVKFSKKTVDELAFLVADAAQEYAALATELGILKPRSAMKSFAASTFDLAFVREQKQLADEGLNDFAINLHHE